MVEQGLARAVPLRPRLLPSSRPYTTPAQPGPLIGRDALRADLSDRLLNADVRLLTLTGPGGSGKTRLAIDAAANLADQFDLGACFVDLSAVRESELVLPVVARALRVPGSTERSALEVIRDHLGDRTVLAVLDNFEQVSEAATDIAALLAECPKLTLLVTSRAALRIRWEHELPVPPLAVPDLTRLPRAEDLARIPSVALFAERARMIRPDLVVDESVGRAIAEICVRLDGLPLALELAAARTKFMSPAALLTRLVGRIDVLGPAMQDVPARQRTLGNTMEWSYDLLTPDEQRSFRQLSVFDGGCSLESAQAMLDLDSIATLERLESLVDKSLLRPVVEDNELDAEPRFQMLETVRQYGVERLTGPGEARWARDRHAAICLAVAESAAPSLGGAGQVASLTRLEIEHANMRAALAWTFETGGPTLRLTGALWRFWEVRGYLGEGRQWLHRALDADDGADPSARANALIGAGTLASRQADYANAAALFEEALGLYRRVGDRSGQALALQALGVQAQMQSDFARAEALHEEGLALYRALDDTHGISYSLNNLGYMLWRQGRLNEAAALHEESVALARRLGDKRLIAVPVYNLGVLACLGREYTRAAALFTEALVLFRELGDKRWIAFSLSDLGDIAQKEHEPERAIRLGQEALGLFAEVGDKFGMALTSERLARACTDYGDRPELAVRLFSAADALRQAIKSPRPPGEDRQDDSAYLTQLEEQLGTVHFTSAWAEARAMGADAVLREAQAMPASVTARANLRGAPAVGRGPLTAREQEVALLIAQGLTNRQIGAELVLSERTVDAHVDHIRQKLGIRSRARIAAWVTSQGIR